MTPLKGTSRSLIEAARAAERPSDADRNRVRARVMAKVAGAGAAAAATGVTAAGKAASVTAAGVGASAGIVKAIVVGTLAGVFVLGAAEVTRAPVDRSNEVRAVASVAVVVPTSMPVGQRAAPSNEAPKPAPTAPEPRAMRADTRPTSSAGLREEVEILKEAQRAMAAGETDRAVALLDEHAQRWKGGALAEERLAARAIALCDAKRADEARRAATRFFAEAKGSPLEERVRAACGGVLSNEK